MTGMILIKDKSIQFARIVLGDNSVLLEMINKSDSVFAISYAYKDEENIKKTIEECNTTVKTDEDKAVSIVESIIGKNSILIRKDIAHQLVDVYQENPSAPLSALLKK